ncbi:hypothetical protein ACTJKO_05775 [Curtobacterium sp. 22159]|uniref:hypothetical protein n=1 Tax=Curtobacterium sp. 22159 TaxID=3453882 RepID=UPI003F879060
MAPGNSLIDVANQRARVHTGELIQVGDAHYTVTSTRLERKAAVPGEALALRVQAATGA